MAQMEDLASRLRHAALGRPPPADGLVEVLPSPPGPADAVVAFTAHSVVASSGVAPEEVRSRLDPGDLGAALRAPFLTWLAQDIGTVAGTLDVVLAASRCAGPPPLELHPLEVGDHPRVARANRYREDVQAWGTGADNVGVLVVGQGLAGRWEVAFEVESEHRGGGIGRALALAARHLVTDDVVFAQVAPGNAASLRAVLAAGYHPIGAEVLFLRRR